MIKLAVADYCHECCDFEPELRLNIVCVDDFNFDETPCEMYGHQVSKLVQCKHRERCSNIHNHIERQMKNNDKT